MKVSSIDFIVPITKVRIAYANMHEEHKLNEILGEEKDKECISIDIIESTGSSSNKGFVLKFTDKGECEKYNDYFKTRIDRVSKKRRST